MGLARSAAVVIGGFPLGESDRVVTFFSRSFGKVRGVARAARRLRSRFGGALELFTLGELVFFDSGRSDLVQVDHFDVVHPFQRVREDLDRLGHAAWMAECVTRLTADRDPNPAVYGLLTRALRSVEAGAAPAAVAVAFGARCVDALGHRLRLDACVGCGRRGLPPRGAVGIDLAAGGVVCPECSRELGGDVTLSHPTLVTLRRLRTASWSEATRTAPAAETAELKRLLDAQMESLGGYPPRTARFLREVARLSRRGGEPR